jgi:hypothetical protein
MKNRCTDVYRASFTGLRMHAFGFDKVTHWNAEIEIYQARVLPELWRARPMIKHGAHVWEHFDRYALMSIINSDFVGVVKPWRAWNLKGQPIVDRHLNFHVENGLKTD